MIDLTEKVKGLPIKEYFVTGSSLVRSLEPQDLDVVCLFECVDEINDLARSLDNAKEMYGDSRFFSIRDNDVNFICTTELEFFYRFKAYSGVLARLQLKDKADRVEIAKACLYWEYTKEGAPAL